VDAEPLTRLLASGARTVTHNGVQAATAGDCDKVGPIATYATPDLLLQHPDKTLAIYVQKQLKYLQSTKKLENTCVAIAKHMQHPDKTLVTYV
jgi:hypothetical protein